MTGLKKFFHNKRVICICSAKKMLCDMTTQCSFNIYTIQASDVLAALNH